MSGFEAVTLSWNGRDYVVPVNKVMGLLHLIESTLIGDSDEDAMTVLMDRRRRVPIASAFENALAYAGAELPSGEVYLAVMRGLAGDRVDHVKQMFDATMNLLAVLAPPVHAQILTGMSSGEEPAGKK